jgi:hypothetical protein
LHKAMGLTPGRAVSEWPGFKEAPGL